MSGVLPALCENPLVSEVEKEHYLKFFYVIDFFLHRARTSLLVPVIVDYECAKHRFIISSLPLRPYIWSENRYSVKILEPSEHLELDCGNTIRGEVGWSG